MEDVQPNELRLSRKGSARVPTVRSSYRGTPWRGYHGRRQTQRTSESNSPKESRSRDGPASSRQHLAQHPPRVPSRETHAHVQDVAGSTYHADIAAHFEQLSRRVRTSTISASPLSCQQGFSSLGKPRRNSKQLDVIINPSPECHSGAPGSQQACKEWFTKKQTQCIQRDLGSLVNGSNSRICSRMQDHSLRRSIIHVPAHGSDRNNHFNEEHSHPAVYLPPKIQPRHCPPEAVKLLVTYSPNVVEPEVVAPVDMPSPSPNLILAAESEQLHEGRFYQVPYVDGRQNIPNRGFAPSLSTNPDKIIDLTQGLSESVEKVHRWSDFHSGVLDLLLFPPAQTSSSRSPIPTAATTRLARDGQQDTVELDIAINGTDQHPATIDLTKDDDEYHCYGQPIVVEPDHPAIPKDHENPLPTTFDLIDNFRLPLELQDRLRRVINTDSFSLIAVTMQGFINSIHKIDSSRHYQSLWSPSIPTQEHVDDACLLHSGHDTITIVLAHAREDAQLTFLSLKGNQVSNENTLPRNWNKAKKGGVSALTAMMQPLKFASGGYDHKIHLWSMKDDLSHASSMPLAVKHTSVIHSLLPIRDTSHKLVSAGADRNVHLWDLCSERVAHTLRTSNIPYNIHRTESPFCTLLEVAHLDLQYEVHDHRMIPRRPAQRFGFTTQAPPGRYMKGDTWTHFFVSGDRIGRVRVWDLRNVSKEPYLCQCFENEVIQVVKTDSHILACSKRSEYRLISIHGG